MPPTARWERSSETERRNKLIVGCPSISGIISFASARNVTFAIRYCSYRVAAPCLRRLRQSCSGNLPFGFFKRTAVRHDTFVETSEAIECGASRTRASESESSATAEKRKWDPRLYIDTVETAHVNQDAVTKRACPNGVSASRPGFHHIGHHIFNSC
jgi:hypothetical protein